MKIKRSLAALAVGASLSSCAGPRPIPALSLANPGIADHSGERDWFGLALSIQNPAQFKAWEPVVEEITGKEAVPAERVVFLSDEHIGRFCTDVRDGCYDPVSGGIAIRAGIPAGERAGGSYSSGFGGCKGLPSEDLQAESRFSVWVHEQGHHPDLGHGADPLGRYVGQVEAVSFEYYFAEHVAAHYSRHLGLNLIVNNLKKARMEAWSDLSKPEAATYYADKLIGGLTQLPSDAKKADEAGIVHLGVLSLMASGFDSFGEVWRYVHAHGHEEVALRIRRHAHLVTRGRIRADKLVFALSGKEIREEGGISFGAEPDIGELRLPVIVATPPSRILELDFGMEKAAFARLESGRFHLQIMDRASGIEISAARLQSGNPDLSISVKKRGSPLLSIERRTEGISTLVYHTAAMAGPSFCHSSEKDASSESETLKQQVRMQFEGIIRALDRPGKYPEEAKLARQVVEGVFGQNEPAHPQPQHVFNP